VVLLDVVKAGAAFVPVDQDGPRFPRGPILSHRIFVFKGERKADLAHTTLLSELPSELTSECYAQVMSAEPQSHDQCL
jgi:hypothetical protein